MAFTVGQRVWFKRAGSTPFVTGTASAAKTVFDSALGGRGEPSITFSGGTIAGGGRLGIPGQPAFTDLLKTKLNTGNESTEHTVSGTFNITAGTKLAVQEKSSHPLDPGAVTVGGVFDDPTEVTLFGNQDEAGTDGPATTLRTTNPNYPTGRPNATSTGGTKLPLSGTHEFDNETINVAGTTVGLRTPSSEEGAGIVIQVVTGKVGSISPDGTKLTGSATMYYVNWGASSVSNPHRAKWNNRFRVQLHAEADLIAA